MAPASLKRHLRPQLLEADDRAVLEAPPADGRGAHVVRAGLGVGQVDEAGLVEVRGEGHVQQTALAVGEDLGRALHDRRLARAVDQPEPAGPLGHQRAAVRQERDAPRVVEPALDLDHAHRPRLGVDGLHHGR